MIGEVRNLKKMKKLCCPLGFNAANLVSTSAGPSLSEHLIRLFGHKRWDCFKILLMRMLSIVTETLF